MWRSTILSGIPSAVTLVVCLFVGVKVLPLGLEDWTWKYASVSLWDRAWLPAAVFLLLAGLLKACATRLTEMSRREEVLAIVLLVVLACALHFSTASLGKGGLQDAVIATIAPHVSGYHAAAYNVSDARLFLAHYADYIAQINMRSSLMHVAQHPPGPVLYYWSHDQFFRRFARLGGRIAAAIEKRLPGAGSAFDELNLALDPPRRAAIWISAFRLFILAGLAILPTYLLARTLHGPSVALWAAGFSALIPSLHLFSPYFDQAYPVFAVLFYWLSLLALRRQSLALAGLAGFTFSLCMFLSAASLTILGLVTLGLAPEALTPPSAPSPTPPHPHPPTRPYVRLLASALAGFLLPVALLYLVFHYNSFAVWRICLAKHDQFYEIYPKTYWKWVLYGPVEFLIFTGIPVACGFLAAVGREAYGRVGGWANGRMGDPLTVSLAVVLLLLNFSGQNLSEVGRLWMFFMPFASIAAAKAFQPLPANGLFLLLAAQGLQVVTFKLSLDVLGIY